MAHEPLPPEALARTTSPDALPFETTAELPPLAEPIGQERALEALRFGLGVRSDGFHLFVMGPAGVGRRTLVRAHLEARAAREETPPDLCYVNDFARPQQPAPLLLPAGRGRVLAKALAHLVEELRSVIPAAFESDEFRHKKSKIEEELRESHGRRLESLRDRASERGVALVRTPVGFAIAALRGTEIMEPSEFEAMPERQRKERHAAMDEVKQELTAILDDLPRVEKRVRAEIRALVRETATGAVRHLVDDLRAEWRAEAEVLAHLDALEHHVLDNVEEFAKPEGEPNPLDAALGALGVAGGAGAASRRYGVNVVVDNGGAKGAPVVFEDHPTYQNLLGRIEHLQQFGALVTDFSLVKGGALHRANGGYLVLDARQLLLQPFAWDALKRALRAREIRIEPLGQQLGLVSTASLEPRPIPLGVKVVLVGERELYWLLDRFDPDFRGLFKVAVDFAEELPRSAEADLAYARLLARLVEEERLPPVHRSGVARVLDHATRLAGDVERRSALVADVFDVVREAAFWARERGAERVERVDVDRALEAAEHRHGRVRERLLEEIDRGTYLVDVSGARVGQVNGLSVLLLPHAEFGRPSRITAKVRLGRGDVVDVEREVDLGGPIHSKGVLLLSAFLGARFATEHPLSLSATIAFEQSYGMVEGDSASCAELCALLSALADVPLSQALALTGSVNQHGEVQAIGGANEKIEGFFDVCSRRGLTGEQGVIIPASNVRHLSLRADVVDAARAGRFRIFAVRHVDEAIELLSGLPAGERADGKFPDGSVNARVEARLVALAERRIELGARGASGAER